MFTSPLIAVLRPQRLRDSRLRHWLAKPVIEHHDSDRPFRLRRLSLLLLAGGWGVFLLSCLAGIAIVQAHVPIRPWADLIGDSFFNEAGLAAATRPALQWARAIGEALGSASFFAGLASVAFFDRRDDRRGLVRAK